MYVSTFNTLIRSTFKISKQRKNYANRLKIFTSTWGSWKPAESEKGEGDKSHYERWKTQAESNKCGRVAFENGRPRLEGNTRQFVYVSAVTCQQRWEPCQNAEEMSRGEEQYEVKLGTGPQVECVVRVCVTSRQRGRLPSSGQMAQHSSWGMTGLGQSLVSSQMTSSHITVPLSHTQIWHGSGFHTSRSANTWPSKVQLLLRPAEGGRRVGVGGGEPLVKFGWEPRTEHRAFSLSSKTEYNEVSMCDGSERHQLKHKRTVQPLS